MLCASLVHSCLLLSSFSWCVCNHSLFNHSPFEGHFGCFLFLATKMLWTFIYTFLCEHKLGWIPKSAVQLIDWYWMFSVWNNNLLVFRVAVPFYIANRKVWVIISSHPCQHLMFTFFFFCAILIDRYVLTTLCACISLIILNIFSRTYLPSVLSSLVKWLFMSFVHLLIIFSCI